MIGQKLTNFTVNKLILLAKRCEFVVRPLGARIQVNRHSHEGSNRSLGSTLFSRKVLAPRVKSTRVVSVLFAFLLASCGSSASSSSSPATTASSGSGSTSSSSSSSSSSVSITCPSPTVLASMFGHAFPTPVISKPSTISRGYYCGYIDSAQLMGLGITFYTTPSNGLFGSVKQQLEGEAKTLSGARVISIAGLGSSAYELTFNNQSEGPMSTLVTTGSTRISIVAQDSFVGNVVTLARYILAH